LGFLKEGYVSFVVNDLFANIELELEGELAGAHQAYVAHLPTVNMPGFTVSITHKLLDCNLDLIDVGTDTWTRDYKPYLRSPDTCSAPA
jgi:hypothetical protein